MANQVTVEKFVDVSRFFLAVSAVEQALTLTENPTPALLKHLKAADPLIKIAAGFLDAGIDSILRETFDKAKIRNKSLLDRALTGGTLSSYGKRATFLQDQLPRLQTHAPAVKDSFGDDFALMRKVIEAAAIENPSARVFALAEFRMADGKLMRLKKWVEKASELFGNPVSDMDTLATDLIAVDSATDALISVQAKAAAKDPTDPESVALKAQAERLKSTIKQVSEQSSDPRTVTARASAKIADNRDGHATAIGRFLEATPQQEDALTTRGHVIMAASAGSGKTRVLAGKVIHHVVDLKTPISSIMAVSFTRKASVELKARILKYAKDSGVNLPAKNDYSAYEGVGTTHKIGRGILTKSGRGYRISTDPKDKKNAVIAGAELSNLIKVAIKQVKMTGSGSAPGPNDMSFFPTVNPKGPPSASSNDQAIENQSPTTNPSGGSATAFDEYLQNPARYAAITAAAADTLREFLKATFKVTTGQGNYGYWVRVAGPALDRFGADIANVPLSGGRISWKPPSDRGPGAFFGNSKSPWDVNTVQATLENYFGFPQAKNALALISGLASKDPAALKPEDKQVLQDILSNPTVSEGVRARNVMKAAARKRDDSNLTVSEDGIEVAGEVKESRALDNQTGPYFVYANRPAKQWFNIGASDEDFETIDEKGKVKKLSVSDFTRYIGLHKNNLVAPGAAFVSSSGIEPQGFGEDDADTVQVDGVDPEQAQIFAAVYGAYEWLKRNIPDFQGRVDHDDQLILSSKELIEQPRLLRSYQQQYKCVLVDEAQDLNKCVSGDTEVQTPTGTKLVRDLIVGESVLSFENGRVVYNPVTQKVRSNWNRGYRIRLTSGDSLLMSPDHRIYATPLDTCPKGEMALYVMYRKGMGFRIGTTERMFQARDGSIGRGAQERADCAWILEVGPADDILYKEQALSLQYRVPTYIFEGTQRGCNQDRIDKIFQQFGDNGRSLLAEYDLDFNYPNWVSSGNDRGSITRRVVNFNAHRGKGQKITQRGSNVTMSWTNGDFDFDVPVYTVKGGRKMVNVLTEDYATGRGLAQEIAKKADAFLVENLILDGVRLPLITASGLLPGMRVPVWCGGVDVRHKDLLPTETYRQLASKFGIDHSGLDGRVESRKREIHGKVREAQLRAGLTDVIPDLSQATVDLTEIESVEVVQEGGDFWDLAVDGSHNFFGNNILSHNCQHVLFGLITGSLDPATLKPRADGKMSADTFALIGDDRQCLGRGTQILTPRGLVKIEELHAGDPVLAYRNGKIVSQTVKYATQTQWTWGYTITLESGKTLTMSPTHRLWATEPKTEEDQMVVYLMFRKDMGFRVGITNKGKTGLEEGYTNSYGNRASSERAEKLWVLDVCQGREEALLRELSYSLEYGIPTCVFSGENRGLNQDRIDAVFQRFGKNGARLLEEKHLSIELPHWMSQSYTKHGRARHVVQVLAHTSSGTQVLMEWEGDKFDAALVGVTGVAKTTDDRRRLRRYLPNYREALALAKRVSEATGANISYRLATDEGTLREITASGLHVGMSVPTTDDQETLVHDKITLIERTEGDFFDLDVEDASNIIGNGILTHNSIYRFRGGVPELFTGKSDLVPGGEGWTTKVLDTNFRSGALIVGTAQKIISYNTNQIPMVCKTDPKKGDGSVYRVPVEDISDAGDYVADQIESARKEAEEDGDTKDFYKKYGIALRTNREVYGYVMKLIEKGIPFRSKKNPLKGPVVKPVVALFNLNSTSVKARNQSVLDGVRCPDFGINSENMSKKLVEAGVTDFYNELVNGDAARFVYSRGSYRARLDQYIAYIQEVAGLLASQSADDVMSFVLSYKSPDGTTFIDSICADAKNDAELMEEVQTIADQENDGDITPEMIRNAALGPINPLRVAAGRFPTATAFNDYIQSLNAANDRTEKKEDDVEADAVQIDTVHGWKGLEVSNLYLAMWQGGFPHARSTRDPELMEEERRVAYVAITRAADNLRIIEPRTVQGKPVEPSQFVTEGCIPLMGDTTKEASLRTASLKLSDYHIPTHYTETEYGEEPTDIDMGPALENAWPDYMVGGEEA